MKITRFTNNLKASLRDLMVKLTYSSKDLVYLVNIGEKLDSFNSLVKALKTTSLMKTMIM